MSKWVAASVLSGASALAAYLAIHALKNGLESATPAEAWLIARLCSRNLDQELAALSAEPER